MDRKANHEMWMKHS